MISGVINPEGGRFWDTGYISTLYSNWDISTYFSICSEVTPPSVHPRIAKCTMLVLFTISLQIKNEILASSALEMWPKPHNVEPGHMTLSTSTCEIVSYHKANTSRGKLVCKIWSF